MEFIARFREEVRKVGEADAKDGVGNEGLEGQIGKKGTGVNKKRRLCEGQRWWKRRAEEKQEREEEAVQEVG